MHGLWSTFVEAELTGGVDAWRAAAEAAAAPRALGLLRPYALLRLGEALLAEATGGEARSSEARSGDDARGEARRVLQSARDLAEERGVSAVLASVVRVAAAAGLALDGGGAARDAVGVTDAVDHGAAATAELTARERQVLELIAEGLSNRQIGERLFISGKTASVHVSAILRKLGASTRTEAVYRAGASVR
ncbi:response regulator transcription factor [Agromyces soli]